MSETLTGLPFNRALYAPEYQHEDLLPFIEEVQAFERRLRAVGAPYRMDHQHRTWEYANVLRQLTVLGMIPPATILDTGSGGSFLPALLAAKGFEVTASDSMAYGDCTEWIYRQCVALGLTIPIVREPVEALASVPDESFDVTLCISVIEHVDPTHYEDAWRELARVTTQGGLIMVTSDYFRDLAAWERSPYKQIQHNVFTTEAIEEFRASFPTLELVGGIDLTYRGDWVNNYSFINLCLIKRA